MPYNFSFIIPELLAGMACPGVMSPLVQDLQELQENGISSIVTLTEYPLPHELLEAAGFDYLHLPIIDLTPPTMQQIYTFNEYIADKHQAKRGVAVHCAAGMGRTGTMLACYLVYIGETAEDAIDSIRTIRPGSIETSDQEEIIYRFYKENAQNGRCK